MMSDTARTEEIDQVISSVRDLVSSGEKRADHAGSKTTDAALERFVLTPALRVTDPEPGEVEMTDTPPDPTPENVLILDAAKRAGREGLEATIAELEAAVRSQTADADREDEEDFEEEIVWATDVFPDERSGEDEDGEADAGPLADTDSEVMPLISADDDEPAHAGLADFFDSSQSLDKEILRDMVAKIVREELSGELGEQITRSVRKLVRREINRVLASRDLE